VTPDELLLLRASLLQSDPALAAWRRFRLTHPDIDHLEGDAFQLLPQLHCNLRLVIPDDPALGRLKGIYRRAWYTNQLLLRTGAQAVAQLRAAGIDVMLYERTALTAGLEEGGARPMEMVDLLLRPHDTERALAALAPHGWARRPTQGTRIGRVVELTGGDNVGLRLHRSALHPRGYDETLWNDAVTVSVCGVETRAPGPTDQVLLACTQGLGWTQAPLRWIPDAVLAVRAAAGRCDWQGLAARASEGEVTLQLADAIELLVAEFPHDVPDALLAELRRRRASAGERILHRIKLTPRRRDPLSRLARRTAWRWEVRRRLEAPSPSDMVRRGRNGG
jgi:hypothetical protein